MRKEVMRKEAVITGGLALIGAYLYFQGEGEKSNNHLTGGGYIPKKMIPVEPPVEPTSITYNIQFPELNIPQYTPSFTTPSFTREPSPKTKKSKTVSPPSTGSPIMMDMLSPPPGPSPTVDALKKKDIWLVNASAMEPNIGLNIPPPPGLDALTKGLGSITGALKKKDINIPPPPGLDALTKGLDALTKGLGSITGALKKKDLKKKD